MPKNYVFDALHDAFLECMENGMSVQGAAKLYGVPKSTLWDRVTGKVDAMKWKPGPSPVFLPVEENQLADYFKTMAG